MSGVPVNTPKEANDVYKKYMANLAIQAQNYAVQTKQMQAYLETGAISAFPDTTTVEDYFKDAQRLKMDVAKELTKITNDGFAANAVVAKLSNEELQYTANDIKRIMDDLSKYKYGLPQPALLNYLKQSYQKFLATNGVSFPAQEPTLKSLVQSLNNGRVINSAPVGLFDPIQSTPVSFSSGNNSAFSKPSSDSTTSWTTISDSPSSISGTPTTWATTVSNSNASTPYSSVPPSPYVQSNTPSVSAPPSRIQTPSKIQTPSGSRLPDGFLSQLNNRLEQLGRSPEAINAQSDAQLAQEAQQIPSVDRAAIDRQYDLETLDGASWPKIREWWAYWVSNPEYSDTLRRHTPKALIVSRGENKGNQLIYSNGDYTVDVRKNMLMKAFTAWRRQRNGDPETLSVSPVVPVSGMDDDELEEAHAQMQQVMTARQLMEERRRMNDEENAARQEFYAQQRDIGGSGVIHNNVRRYPPTLMRGGNNRPTVSLLKQMAHHQHQQMPAPPGRRISGGSLFPQKKRVSIQVDDTKGLLPTSSTYVPFGKYIISLSHLDKNKLKLRNIHGKSVGKLPEIGISSDMSRILKRLIDGGNVDTKDFDTLTSRDKEQLQQIAKEAKIADRIHLNEDLSKTDQDLNRFSLLQGEIFAGNDNVQMLKEFKLLVIKLAKNGHITQRDAQDTLSTLAAAGY
jgi:hypothetical protein